MRAEIRIRPKAKVNLSPVVKIDIIAFPRMYGDRVRPRLLN